MQNRGISQAVIRRLPRYYRYLGELIEQGVERISSNELSKRMKVTASSDSRINVHSQQSHFPGDSDLYVQNSIFREHCVLPEILQL